MYLVTKEVKEGHAIPAPYDIKDCEYKLQESICNADDNCSKHVSAPILQFKIIS